MLRFISIKVMQSLITFFLAAIIIFAGVRALPGDPAVAMAGEEATPERIAAIRADLGLDEPVVIQFFTFLKNIFTGDLGESTRTGQKVTEMIATTLPVTLWLSFLAIVVAVIFGIAFGIIAERNRGNAIEGAANTTALLGLSVPNFWLGLLAIIFFAVILGWFPASGYVAFFDNPVQSLYHLAMPALILGISLAAVITRQTRASMIESMSSDYVRLAKAKGLSKPTILFRYGLRNSLMVLVTIIGLQLGGLISGAVVTEKIFALPGIGKLTLDAVFTRDYPVIQAVVLVITVSYMVINLAVDLLYSVINPQVRVQEAK